MNVKHGAIFDKWENIQIGHTITKNCETLSHFMIKEQM